MVYLAAAVVVVGLLCLLNLLLAFGIIRRLREHTKLLGNLPQQASPVNVAVGEAPKDFTATTTTGQTVSPSGFTGPVLIGFFSPGCEPCAIELPRFVEYAQALPGVDVLAVIDGSAGEATEYVERLTPVAQVVLEGPDGAMKSAFKLAAYPTIYLLGADGTVAAGGTTMSAIGPVPTVDAAAA
ncbi:TlpA family protein disulfide reductase [Rhizomonospora bruguierae]|uniref:TlpA family protein disulfide reductase n=1 Tax=Rhizomonospora bruguierae TaxID=1581705 RepID=UPI001BD1800C|nr:TlpA disulfide reductase family protein [Micromonospora sp. NBRC 107566]